MTKNEDENEDEDEKPSCLNCNRELDPMESVYCIGCSHLFAECDHDWEVCNESFNHEYGCEQIWVDRCRLCDEERPHDPPSFNDDIF
jgi:hypothetical protein